MARSEARSIQAAAIQAAPVFLDLDASTTRLCDLVADAARGGARLIVFPESFLPAYPDWVWTLPLKERAQVGALYRELLENAVEIPGPAIERLCAAARAARAFVVGGVTERNVEASGTSLYNTLVFIDDQGRLLGRHRKLMPTGGERLIWAQGDGSTLNVWDTSLGRLGGLICWENYMPLARYTLYAAGEQIHCAPTWDRGDGWLATLRHVALEGRMFVIGCCQALHRDAIPDRYAFKQGYAADRTWINVGDSAIVAPDGRVLAGPLHEQEGILQAELDLSLTASGRWMFDAAGHYARPDVFQLRVNREPRPMLREETQTVKPAESPADELTS
jgi:nitrilase